MRTLEFSAAKGAKEGKWQLSGVGHFDGSMGWTGTIPPPGIDAKNDMYEIGVAHEYQYNWPAYRKRFV